MVKYFKSEYGALVASMAAAETAGNTETAAPTPGAVDKARRAFRKHLVDLAHYHFGGVRQNFSNAELREVRGIYLGDAKAEGIKGWIDLILTLEVECKACDATGVYVTQHNTEEDCFRCCGRGRQGQKDRLRNRGHDMVKAEEWEKANANRRPPPDTRVVQE